jgi:hypothetical protein
MFNGSAGVRRSATPAVLGAAVLLVATACSSSSSSGSSSTPSTAPATSATSTTSAMATGSTAAMACSTAVAPTVSGSGPTDTTSTGKLVAENFQKFFDPATSTATKLSLLQNGVAFAPVLQGFAGNPLASKATATVLTVDFTGAATASVTFNLCESGAPALPGSAGKSVLQGGVWKVADSTLCSLVKLNNGGAAVPGCS